MEFFLAELYDRTNTKNIYDLECINDSQLNYLKVYTDKQIINSLLFSWVYKSIFKILPSKLEITSKYDQAHDIISYLTRTSFARFMHLDELHDFNTYKKSLDNIAFCKQELYLKLKNRLNDGLAYDPQVTLFKHFEHCMTLSFYDSELDKIKLCKCNPFSKMIPSNTMKPDNFNSVTFIDYLKHIVSSDYYFLRNIYQNKVIISNDVKLPSYYTLSNVYIDTVPKIADFCVSFYNTLTLAQTGKTLFLGLDTPETLVSTYIKRFLKQNISVPVEIQKIMWQKFIFMGELKIKKESKNCVLMIDNRKNITSVLSIAMTFSNLMPDFWSLVIVTKPENHKWYQEKLGENVHVHFLSHDLQDSEVFNIDDYNLMMKDNSFWENVKSLGCEKCLLIQDDGFLVKPGVEEYLEYDWVGAPWPRTKNLIDIGVTSFVGNGGLSIRNIQYMIDITMDESSCKNILFNYNIQPIPEDVYFSIEIAKKNGNVPTEEKAKDFASEMILFKNSIGIHKPWGYFKLEDIIEMFF